MASQGEQRFHVFDVVMPTDRAPGASGKMVVCQVRLHGDGTYSYVVGNVDSRGDEDGGGLYKQDDLRALGSRVDETLYRMPGPFDYRDVVLISAYHEDQTIRGKRGVVEGWYDESEENPATVGVWIEEVGEFWVIEPKDLVATGEKAPRPQPGQPMKSTKVGVDGSVLGTEEYVVIDDLLFHL